MEITSKIYNHFQNLALLFIFLRIFSPYLIGTLCLYRVLQSSSTIAGEVVEEIIWSTTCKQVLQIRHRFRLRHFYIGVALIVVIVDFYEMKTIR
jgi:hypothetical protein